MVLTSDWVGDWRQEVVIQHHILTIYHTLVRPRTIQSGVKKSKKLVREALKTVGNTVEQIHFFLLPLCWKEKTEGWGYQHYIIPHYSTTPCFASSILPFLFLEYIWGIPIPWRFLLPFCPQLIKLYKVFSSQIVELYLLCFYNTFKYYQHFLQTVDMCRYNCYLLLHIRAWFCPQTFLRTLDDQLPSLSGVHGSWFEGFSLKCPSSWILWWTMDEFTVLEVF